MNLSHAYDADFSVNKTFKFSKSGGLGAVCRHHRSRRSARIELILLTQSRRISQMPPRERVEVFLRAISLNSLVSESKSGEEIRQRWGSTERGVEFVDRTEERTYTLACYGYEPPLLQAKIEKGWATWTSTDPGVLEAFEDLIGPAMNPSDPARLDRLASDAARSIRSGSWSAAKRDASEVLQYRPDDIEAMFALGLAHAALDEFVQAEQALRKVIASAPNHVDALYCLGNLRIEQKNFLAAEEFLRKAVAIDPRNHAAWARLGFALDTMGRRREAIPAYENALETSPNPGGVFGYTGLDFTGDVIEALDRLKR